MFPSGFNQKTTKEDLIVKGKYGVPPWYLCGKTLEHSRSHVTKAESKGMTCGAAQPHYQASWPPWAHLSTLSLCQFPTAFEDVSKLLLKLI